MNKKLTLIFLVCALTLIIIGSISAGLLNYFGMITAKVNINEPEIGVNVPAIEEDCKNNKWKNLVTLGNRPFRNHGDCISYIETNMCEDFELFEEYPENFSSFGSCNSYFSSNKIKKDNEIKGLEERINNETPEDNETKKPLNNSENTTTIVTNSSYENQTIKKNNSEYNETMEINLNETIEEPNNTNDELNDSSTNEDKEETNSTETNENTEENSDSSDSENNETEELNNETDS